MAEALCPCHDPPARSGLSRCAWSRQQGGVARPPPRAGTRSAGGLWPFPVRNEGRRSIVVTFFMTEVKKKS